MSQPLPSLTLAALVRAHFDLTQQELADYLGVTRGQIAHYEAGRRRSPAMQTLRLTRLARLLPPPEGVGPAAPRSAFAPPVVPAVLFGEGLPVVGPLAPGAVGQRQRQLAARIALGRAKLLALTARATRHEHRAWALPVLAAILTAHPADPGAATPAELTHAERWLTGLAAAVPPPPALRPDTRTALALLLVRLAALEAEAAALTQLAAEAAALPPA